MPGQCLQGKLFEGTWAAGASPYPHKLSSICYPLFLYHLVWRLIVFWSYLFSLVQLLFSYLFIHYKAGHYFKYCTLMNNEIYHLWHLCLLSLINTDQSSIGVSSVLCTYYLFWLCPHRILWIQRSIDISSHMYSLNCIIEWPVLFKCSMT